MDLSDLHSAASRFDGGKLFQAYIISGQGTGKMNLAKHLAARAVCSAGGQVPCGACSDCRKAAAGIHPDIIFVEPPANEKDTKDYTADAIRKMCADSAVVPNEARRKVYIITDASRLSETCQNILLKTLEEPPAHAVFIIVADNSGNLLVTVRSRCVELSVTPEKDAALCSDAVQNMASGLMDAMLSGSRMAAAEYLYSLDGISKADASELPDEMLRRCASAIRGNASGCPCGISDEKLLHMAEVFTQVGKYLGYNVSTGHIIGLLMAELL